MKKAEFIKELEKGLKPILTKSEIKEAILYYDELISDRLDAKETEEDIIKSLGSIDYIIKVISVERIEKRPETKNIKSLYFSFTSIIRLATTPILVFFALVFGIIFISLAITMLSVFIAFCFSMLAIILSAFDSVILVTESSGGIWSIIFVISLHTFIFGILLALSIFLKDLLYLSINKTLKLFTKIFKRRVV